MTFQAVETGLFDAIAHLDFVRWLNDKNRFGIWSGNYVPRKHKDAFRKVFAVMEKRCIALEVNSSGLTKSFLSILPCPEVLVWARDFELMYVFGADAHEADKVGAGYEKVLSALDRGQQERLVTFRDRKAVFLNSIETGLRTLIQQNPNIPLLLWLMGIECQDNFKLTGKKIYAREGEKSYQTLLKQWDVGPVLLHQTYANILAEQLRP